MAVVKYQRPRNSFLYNVAKGAGGLIKYGSQVMKRNAGFLPVAAAAGSILNNKMSSRSSSKDITGSILTNQYDAGSRYTKRRMPRRRRRAFVKSWKKFQWMVQKQQPLLTWTNGFANNWSGTADTQGTFGTFLYPINLGTNETDLRDIIVAAFGGTLTDHQTKRLYIKSACVDVQMRNSGGSPCIIDVYKVVATGLPWQTAGSSIQGIWNTTYGLQSGTLQAADVALTPFQNPELCKYFKVINKKEILLGTGNVTTLQMRIPGNRPIYGRQLNAAGGTYPRRTMGFIFQIRGTPESGAFSPPNRLSAYSIDVGIQKTYNYGLPPTPTQNETTVNV